MGSDYSHLRTISYKDIYGRVTTAILELGNDGHVYLRLNGSHMRTACQRKEVVVSADSTLVDMLRPSLGLPITLYKNQRR